MDSMRSRLSMLWLFALLNYLYCDVVTLMDPTMLRPFSSGIVGGAEITQTFLVAAGILMEVPIGMVLVARLLAHPRVNRVANIAAGAVLTVVQLGSVVAKPAAPYYLLFSAIEVAATVAIVWTAWRWRASEASGAPTAMPPSVAADLRASPPSEAEGAL